MLKRNREKWQKIILYCQDFASGSYPNSRKRGWIKQMRWLWLHLFCNDGNDNYNDNDGSDAADAAGEFDDGCDWDDDVQYDHATVLMANSDDLEGIKSHYVKEESNLWLSPLLKCDCQYCQYDGIDRWGEKRVGWFEPLLKSESESEEEGSIVEWKSIMGFHPKKQFALYSPPLRCLSHLHNFLIYNQLRENTVETERMEKVCICGMWKYNMTDHKEKSDMILKQQTPFTAKRGIYQLSHLGVENKWNGWHVDR